MEDWQLIHLYGAILNTIFSIFIIFVYIKSKFYHSYAYYFNILFTLVICIRNLIRLIQREEVIDAFCFIQAYVLSTLDKLIQTQITSYTIINYIGMFKNQFFRDNEKHIFIFLTFFSILYSLILTTIFISQGLSSETFCCYVKTSDVIKRVLDTIFSITLSIINVFCTSRIILTLFKSKARETNNKQRNASINLHLTRFILEIIFVTLIFLIVIFSVNKVFAGSLKDAKDIIYEILLLIMEVFYTINKETIKVAKKLICCQTINDWKEIEENENQDNNDETNEGKEISLKST